MCSLVFLGTGGSIQAGEGYGQRRRGKSRGELWGYWQGGRKEGGWEMEGDQVRSCCLFGTAGKEGEVAIS